MILNLPIQHIRSSVPGKVPNAADLLPGQIAVNLHDRLLFSKDDSNNIIVLGTAGGDLAPVAYTGNWDDLTNKPTIPQPYELPVATPSVVGGVKPQAGLTISADGKLESNIWSVAGQNGLPKKGDVVLTRSDLGLDILDGNSRIKPDYLPDYIIGGMVYKGTWDATTNDPTIPPASSTNVGWLYVVNNPGNTDIDGQSVWNRGDWVISNGTSWERVELVAGTVLSVNGETGVISITAANLPDLAVVGKTGEYSDLRNIPLEFTPSHHEHVVDDITNIATVAKTGSYKDLVDLPDPTITEISVNIEGNPNVIHPVQYITSRKLQFPANFVGSVANYKLSGGTEGRARIMLSTNGGDTFTRIGSIMMQTPTLAEFSSVTTGSITMEPGDILRYEWETGNISLITITLQATRII